MNWDIIVRISDTDSYSLNKYNPPCFFIDFERTNSPFEIKHSFDKEFENMPQTAKELLYLAMTVFASDRCISRDFSQDNWKRNVSIHFPVESPSTWISASATLKDTLDFLTGDNWNFFFRPTVAARTNPLITERNDDVNVSLFSGGADSLVGAIDLLTRGEHVVFVGHHGKGVTNSFQVALKDVLENIFPNLGTFCLKYIEPRPFKDFPKESSTRGRSFLFLAMAIAEGAFRAEHTTLYVPENGLISLNVPLVESRTGSLSTRTTHPYFLSKYGELLTKLGLNITINAPYKFKTKGEMFSECLNQQILQELISNSMSCSHPENARWKGLSPNTHCGRCFPCLIRKASFVAANIPDSSSYDINVLANPPDASKASGSDYRAVMMAVKNFKFSHPSKDLFKVLSSGSLPNESIRDFVDVYRRGMNELSMYLTGSGR